MEVISVLKSIQKDQEKWEFEQLKEGGTLVCACRYGSLSFDVQGENGGEDEVEEAVVKRMLGGEIPGEEKQLGGAEPEEGERENGSEGIRARRKRYPGEDG